MNNLEKEKRFLNEGHRSFSNKGWFKFSLTIATKISLHSSVFFGYLVNVESYMKKKQLKRFYKEGLWFYSKLDHAEENINMTKHIQRKCIEELELNGFIETRLGKGKFRWYKIKWENISIILNKWESEIEEGGKSIDIEDSFEIEEDDDWLL